MTTGFPKNSSSVVGARLLNKDIRRLERAAMDEGITRGEFVRDAILEEIRFHEEKQSQSV